MNTETKRHIDGARQVLVGVVPNPTSQIDQITNALIYKFMDDMDQSAIKAGGDPSFFVGDLEKYAWTRLMDPRMGNQERMNLYSEALMKFSESKQLPELFRGIFKSAFLPYRSPEVLGLFLQEINYFDYSHSEELGNAFEYLLSVMGSQGDAGMFRTPRHIIDFIVKVVDPTKDDKVLDPACGTAGFLISAYKNILEQHDGKDDPGKKEKPLTPDQKKKLMENFQGYDISPEMVRLSRVNMYLHQFKNPQIFAYNTLADEERWNDKFDVILANPPFMSAKGSVKPHNKFGVDSNKAEILFVDYIMQHLRPKGRAGIIVPDGIISNSTGANNQLRKNLIEDGLFAVVSLPSGVFNPYAGVKTSILLFNNDVAKQRSEMLFLKIENDGFSLGAQRRENSKNDLPQALDILNKWKKGVKTESRLAMYIKKYKIAENENYYLSGDRYRVATDYTNAKWPMVELGEIADILKGSAITKKDTKEGSVPVIAGGKKPAYYNNESNRVGAVITVSASGAYAGFVNYFDIPIFASDCSTIQSKSNNVSTKFIYSVLKANQKEIYSFQRGGGQPHIYPKDLITLKIPLPPLEIQEQIVAELDGYQNIISGAKQITQNWKPKIEIDPEWEKKKIGELIHTVNPSKKLQKIEYKDKGKYPIIDQSQNEISGWTNDENAVVKLRKDEAVVIFGDHTCCVKYFEEKFVQGADGIKILAIDSMKLMPKFLYYYLLSHPIISEGYKRHFSKLVETNIFFPPFETQKQIVEKIEAERALVESAKKLIEIYEQKTKNVIGKLWEE